MLDMRDTYVPIRSLKLLPASIIGLCAFISSSFIGDAIVPFHDRIMFYSTFFIILSLYSLTLPLLNCIPTMLAVALYIIVHIVVAVAPFTANQNYYGAILTPIAMADLALMYSILYYTYKWHCRLTKD